MAGYIIGNGAVYLLLFISFHRTFIPLPALFRLPQTSTMSIIIPVPVSIDLLGHYSVPAYPCVSYLNQLARANCIDHVRS
ncbi:hypothetical protein BDW75DRAFT_221005 [Aspergillus navahoensis]